MLMYAGNNQKSNCKTIFNMLYLCEDCMKKKVLVTFIEAGFGHIVTAQAILEALNLKKDDEIEIVSANLFHNHPTLKKYEDFLIKEVKSASVNPLHSRIQQLSMHIGGSKNTLNFVNKYIYKKEYSLYIEELKKISPDIIIDTHYFTSFCSVNYRDLYNPKCKVITYNPDNNVHGWWPRNVDYFIVNNSLAKEQAFERGFSRQQVKEVFFITRESLFKADKSKEYYREKYQIPKDKFCVKLADGAYAKAKMESFVKELSKTQLPITIVPMCGKNDKLYNKLIKFKEKVPNNVTLIPLGYVDNIEEVFKASDLFITKAGPNAVLDSVMSRVPVVINYYANGIENATNELFVKKLGCGKTIKNKIKARHFVEKCIENPRLLDKYIQNENKIDIEKNGTKEIADFVLKLCVKAE